MAAARRSVLTRWFGAFVVDAGSIVASYPFPPDPAELAERRRRRRAGRLAPEEERLLAEHPAATLVTRDRRFEARGVALGPGEPTAPEPEPADFGLDASIERQLVLDEGVEALRASWDPSIHVEEAVRAMADLDRGLNLVAERLASWAGRDGLVRDAEAGETPRRVAEAIVAGGWSPEAGLAAPDPALTEGRRALAQLYLTMRATRASLEAAVSGALPVRAPNLSRLLGPELAARLMSQAGGLDRLARLPASTVQVLGAEKAFFEHLRGRAPPPRHGLLFLHPAIQSSGRVARGRLARALAGKAAIAARLDLAGAPVDPTLVAAFERRAAEVRARPARRRARPRR